MDKEFPGIDYACIGQPDGWSALASADVAAGWDKFAECHRWARAADPQCQGQNRQ